jgi:hypothetical protein
MVENIVTIWLNSWGFAFIVAFPSIVIVSPIVHKLVSLVLHEDESNT